MEAIKIVFQSNKPIIQNDDTGVKNSAIWENPAANRQIHIEVNGCNVRMNFPKKSDSIKIDDVKRMLLTGIVKA